MYWAERILIKQILYEAENEASAGKGDTILFKEKTYCTVQMSNM